MYTPESQIEKRMRLDREGLEQAYEHLAASVDSTQRRIRQEVGDVEEFDTVVGFCLRQLGTEAGRVPASCGEGEERLEYLCAPKGVMWREVELHEDWYNRSFGVMLGYLDSGKAVALLPRGLRGYAIFDPASHTHVRVTKKTVKKLSADAVCFYRGLPQGKLKLGDLMRFMLTSVEVGDYVYLGISALIAMLVGMLVPMANQILFAEVIPSGMGRLILPMGVMLVGVLVARASCEMTRSVIVSRVTAKAEVATEAAVMARLLSMPVSFFKELGAGDISNRASAVNTLCTQFFGLLLGGGLSVLVSLFYLLQIAAYAPPLALPALVIVLCDVVVIVASSLVNAKYDELMLAANTQLSGTVTALLGAINKIKLAGAEDRAFAKWAKGYGEYAHSAYDRPRWVRAMPALVTLVGLIGTGVIYYCAAENEVQIPEFMAFNAAFGQLLGAITILSQTTVQIARIGPTLDLVRPIMDAEPELSSNKKLAHVRLGSMEVAGVSFRYAPSTPYVLKNLSFKIQSGEYVGLVGRSGCGKSTVLRLLLGFERPERGAIYVDRHDISKVDVRSLRRSLGTVMQDGKLTVGTLLSNITISNPTATVEDAWEAAEIAGIADDIRAMPMGMHTIVMEGSGGFSGGQKQRILIARAVCGNPHVLLLDEATSALDNVTQQHVADALAKLKCTRLVIAHRLSTVRHCDRILVLDEGQIVEEGTYEELMTLGGIFYELVERQRLGEE
ncbi:MAG: ATP-binding cassette domain-containing protein [Atopobiaceae bacterium]|nr:ATP-binding cassette domain-containing protein [Atopobiaceae bacterium]